MYVKSFFERFWKSEQENVLFVCMPFDDSLNYKFNKIIRPAAKKAKFKDAIRVKENRISDVITTKIFDGIANSKMLLFDLSDDPQSPCKYSEQPNGNVLYELGIANSFRDPQDIILIRKKSPNKLPFDVTGMTYVEYTKMDDKILTKILKEALEQQEWHKSKRVKTTAESIDDIGLSFMLEIGKRPKGKNHFNTLGLPAEQKISVLRLLDLGIIRFATGGPERPYEHAYHWTPFGYEIMKHLGIKQLTMSQFKKLPEYQESLFAEKKFRETRKQIEKMRRKK